ncbi:MAG TPA: hypothetical protein VF166_03520, partial [Gemmatimonadaceae bacterium]
FASLWADHPATVSPLPDVRAFRELAHNYPRRLNEAAWDHRQREISRVSLLRHRPVKWDRGMRLVHMAGALIGSLHLEGALEDALERRLMGYERSPEATARFRSAPPTVLLTTGPFQFEQPAIAASAFRAGVKTLALIPSWDNISTKKRMLFKYDGYLVWSETQRRQLLERYPHTRDCPVYVIGAPQFDVFFQPRFRQTRQEFCAAQELDPSRPVIVYALGSPNFLRGEPYGAEEMARAIAGGELGDAQLLIRPHPIHDNAELDHRFSVFGPSVRVQRTSAPGTPLTARSQDENAIVEWVNTMRHANVVVNLSSTVTVDAALCDTPVVNLDYDPGPDHADDQLIKEINHTWTHFSPVAESEGVWLVNDRAEMIHAVRTYLQQPELHQQGRRWIVEHVCQYADGRCGERMADAVLDFADRVARRSEPSK